MLPAETNIHNPILRKVNPLPTNHLLWERTLLVVTHNSTFSHMGCSDVPGPSHPVSYNDPFIIFFTFSLISQAGGRACDGSSGRLSKNFTICYHLQKFRAEKYRNFTICYHLAKFRPLKTTHYCRAPTIPCLFLDPLAGRPSITEQ